MSDKARNIVILTVLVAIILLIAVSSFKNKKEDSANIIVAVHIKGEVKNPGYYELSYGSRIKDAVDKAGGATEKANLNALNLAAKLRDGDEIVVPTKPSDAAGTDISYSENAININTADVNLLCTLEGIGSETAKAIVDYRIASGGFKKIEELKNVEGIGNAKFETIRDKITV